MMTIFVHQSEDENMPRPGPRLAQAMPCNFLDMALITGLWFGFPKMI